MNLECLCNEVTDISVDGTFECCPKFFYQLYTIHGYKNGNYVPLIYVLLPHKPEKCYADLWHKIIEICNERHLTFNPTSIHSDFEQAMINVIGSVFPETEIKCYQFHLGQAWWRHIQKYRLTAEYKNEEHDIGIWLSKILDFPFCIQTRYRAASSRMWCVMFPTTADASSLLMI